MPRTSQCTIKSWTHQQIVLAARLGWVGLGWDTSETVVTQPGSGHWDICIHHSTLQLQQLAVTLLLILTAGGGEMYRVATLPGGHIQLAVKSSHWSRDFNGEL